MTMKRTLASVVIGALASVSVSTMALAFQEAPMLAEKVKAGELPPVDERLPKHPTVVQAIEVGQYGGTWHRAYSGPGDRWGPTKLMEERVLKWVAKEDNGTAMLEPGYIESYSVNDDSTEYTFTLLEGLKWSDGEPVTTEDVQFWYDDVFMNKDITPTIDPTFAPGGEPMKLEVVDERTFKIKFAAPYVYFLQILAKDSTGSPSLARPSFLFPKHYLKQYNNHYASDDDLAAAAKKYNVEKWADLWDYHGGLTSWWDNPDLPTINAWLMDTAPSVSANNVTMVRNPYYYAVDQDGNQLPYIDKIEHRLFQDPEAVSLMVAQGQIDMQGRYMTAANYTFYKENAERGHYHVNDWVDATTYSMVPNMTVTDEGLNALYENIDFRHALSIAVDRDLINELAFSGLSEPRQASPISGSPYFDAELEKHWADYDPDTANDLLDGIGLDKRDGDGFRLRPDGKRLSIVIEAYEPDQSDALELLADNMRDVGVELLTRIIDRTQWDNNRQNNDYQMQWTRFDRLSIVPADPRIMMGDDSYANQWFVWYKTGGESGIEPPADSEIRTLWKDWESASQAPSVEEADKNVNHLIETFVDQGWVIGVVGETKVPNIVADNFHNVATGLVVDDVTRGIGLARPQQFWIGQE
ncbi:ABC transporter substrate-binding protein [Consotaella aegiceratis]|uniref:ABC transporter substrate-binding protein n=1 Tax=Consotaella aegiceratis TaxID=3097961 RepID=UPI002F410537